MSHHGGYGYGHGGGGGYDQRRGGGGYGGGYDPRHRGRPPPHYGDRRQPPHGGGRERSRSAPPPRRRLDDQDYEVQTNYFKIKPAQQGQESQDLSCVEYRATIYVARKLTRGLNGEALPVPQYTFRERRGENGFIPGSKVELRMEKGATQKTEDICLALHRDLFRQIPSQCIVTDGGRTVFAAKPLVMGKDSPIKDNAVTMTEVKMDEKSGSADVTVKRDPCDSNQLTEKEAVNDTTPSIMFPVTIKKGCRQDDDFADSVPNVHFIVGLEEIGPLFYSRSGDSVWPRNDAEVEKFAQFLNILTRTTMLAADCRSFMSKSRSCFFPRATQERILAGERNAQTPEETLMLGLNQSARACISREIYVARNTNMTWFQLEKSRIQNSEQYSRVPILDPTRGTIAGIRVGELRQPVPLNLRAEIEAALDKLVFHVMFKTRPTEEREKDARARAEKLKGVRSEEEITAFVNKRLSQAIIRPYVWIRQQDTEHKPLVLWAADDDTSEFEYKGSKVNVATYMKRHYGIDLQYPKMPLVQTRFGYYPVEFLFQALEPIKGANEEHHKDAVLRYHDNNAGDKKIGHIQRVVREIHSGSEIERMFGLDISREPVVQPAKLLAEPRLEFGGNQFQEVSNGSWNLVQRGAPLPFIRPADFPSFCVVDFADDKQHELVSGVLNQSGKHALENANYGNEYRHVTEAVTVRAGALHGATMVQQIDDGVKHAIKRAKDFFLFDRSFFFRRRRIMFETIIVHPSGGPTKCLVYPFTDASGQLGIMYPDNILSETHSVRVGGTVHKARMFVVVKTERGEELSVDPFDFRWNSVLSPSETEASGMHWVARRRQDVWETVSFQRFEWRLLHDRSTVVDKSAVVESSPCDITSKIECPAIVFVILEKKEKEPYTVVKYVTNFCRGLQSQCLAWKTYKNQKRPEQYWSNIVLKINTKLSNSMNKAQAWSIGDYRGSRGIPWISDETMIVGIAMSRGGGKDSKTVVSATVILVDASGSCMSNASWVTVQARPDVVQPKVMQSLFKVLTLHISEHTKKFPKQVLVFRDGSSEGNFPSLKEVEITNVRQGLKNAWDEKNKAANPPPEFEPPKLTYVVCVNQHNVQVCPSRGNGVGRQVRNVPSGCCVYDIIMPFHDMQIGNDFLLTAQGGLKGTSKSVFYQTLVNENHLTLTREVLPAVAYALCFCYGTATKATRRLCVTQYSKRLAEQFLSYLPYIDQGGRKQGIDGEPTVFVHPLGEELATRDEPPTSEGAPGSSGSDLLPAFSMQHLESGDWLPPVRAHLAA